MAADPRSLSEHPARGFAHFLFDLDGTLIDSADDLVDATNFALARVGLAVQPRERVIGFVGRGIRRLMASAIESAAPGQGGAALDGALTAFDAFYGENLLRRTRPYDGVPEALEELRSRGARLSVLTNKPARFVATILEGVGFEAVFSQVVADDGRIPRKPDPSGALGLVRSSGIGPGRTLLVGDSVIDLETARAAGISSCVVTWGFTPEAVLLAERPDRVVRDARDLVALCGESS